MATTPNPHLGCFLCMNVAGGSAAADADADAKATRPTKAQAHQAVVAAFNEAMRSGQRPGAVLLQEYSWSTGGKPSLNDLAASLGADWTGVARQFSDKGGRDAVVLYDESLYRGHSLSVTSSVMAASDGAKFGGNVSAGERAGILSYRTRWAGVQLAALDPTTNEATSLQFLLVSYHGRSNKQAGGSKGTLSKLDGNVKRVLAQDFVIEVAKAAVGAKVAFGVAGGFTVKTVPALIAGDWNAERIAFLEFTGLAVGAHPWACTSHGPGQELQPWSVRRNSYGLPKDELDYVVAVNAERRHELSCVVEVREVRALPHLPAHRSLGLFDHDPLLVTFQVRADPGSAARVAAEDADIIIKEAISGRPPGRRLRAEAREHPPPSYKVSPESSPERAQAAQPSGGGHGDRQLPPPQPQEGIAQEERNGSAPAQPIAEAAPPVPPPAAAEAEARAQERATMAAPQLDFTNQAAAVKKLKDMIRQVLGVTEGKHIPYKQAAAQKLAWWPRGVRSSSDFVTFVKERRDEAQRLYSELTILLITEPKGVLPAPSSAGNVSAFGGQVLRRVRSMLRTSSKKLTPEP